MDKKVFIIGNGFDLSLGWLTRYSDYESNREFWPFANEQNSGLALHLYAKAKLEKWLDIEHELFLYASIENNVSFCGNQKSDSKDFLRLKHGLYDYLNTVQQNSPLLDNSIAARVLSKIVKNGKFLDIYTFNYTSLQLIANKLGLGIVRFSYVHGALENNDIILGIDDHETVVDGYDFLFKTFDKNYPSSPIQYALQEANEVVFFGHSLGATDYHYFQNFFKKQSESAMSVKDRKKITIFTFNENSRMDILRQLRNMNDDGSLALLFANNDLQIICTDGTDPKDDMKLESFFKHLDECSVSSDQKKLDSLASMLY